MYGVDGTNEAIYKLKEEPEKGIGEKKKKNIQEEEKEELIKREREEHKTKRVPSSHS